MELIPIVAVLIVALVVYDAKGRSRRASTARPELGGAASGGPDARVAIAVMRVEAKRLLVHPAFAVGLGFAALTTWANGSDPGYLRLDGHWPVFLYFPYCGMVLIAVNLATTRARRHGADELFGTLPASDAARTWGVLGSALTAVAVAPLFLATYVLLSHANGSIGIPDLWELAVVLVLVACAAAAGVMVGRWLPVAAAGIVAVVALGFFQGAVSVSAGPEELSRMHAFAPWHQVSEFAGFDHVLDRRPGWHIVYLIGLGAFAAAIAFLRARVDRRRLVAVGVALGVIAVGGVAQAQPNEASIARLGAYLSDPSAHHTCRTEGTVTYCVYDFAEPVNDRWIEPVAAVLAALPDSVKERPLRIEQRIPGRDIREMPPELLAHLRAPAPTEEPFVWPDDGNLHAGFGLCHDGTCDLAMASDVAAWALGFPVAADPATAFRGEEGYDYFSERTPAEYSGLYDSAGEARGAAALWLAAQASPRAQDQLARRIVPVGSGLTLVSFGWCGAGSEPGATFGIREGVTALELLRLPHATVRDTLHEHWDALVDPLTTTDELLTWFDLPADKDRAPHTFFGC